MANYIITSAIPGFNATYILDSEKKQRDMKTELKRRFPQITFYTGKTNQFGMVVWDMPVFPEGK